MKVYKGAFVVTLGIIIARALSLFFIFPFSNIVGVKGLSLFSYAYIPFNMLLDFTCFGIPQSLTKMSSTYLSTNDKQMARKSFNSSLTIVILISIFSFIILNLFANRYALITSACDCEGAIIAIRIASISLLCVPLSNVLKGYIQSYNKMSVIALSQILEQIIRTGVILLACYLTINVFKANYKIAVYIAVLSTFVASFINVIYLFFCYKRLDDVHFRFDLSLFKKIIKNAFPFFIIGFSLSAYQFIDSLFFNRALIAYGIVDYEYYYGVYAFEILKLVMIPISLSTGFGISLLPNLTKPNSKMISNSFVIVFLILFSIGLYTIFYSNNIYGLFFKNVDIGPNILKTFIMLIVPYSFYTLSSIIMQGIGKGKKVVMSITLGLIIKIIVTYPLIRAYGILGAFLSSFCSLGIVSIINLFYLKELKLKYIKRFLLILAASFISIMIVKLISFNANNILYLSVTASIYFIIIILLYLIVRFMTFDIK